MSPTAGVKSPRIVSLDQFRGYTVAGMMLVNFIGDFTVVHPVFQHHNTYFSYADTIMPAFHFAVGFALRLTLLKRLETLGRRAAYGRVVRRCLGLILLSTVLEAASWGRRFTSFAELGQQGIWGVLAGPLKCEFWETLAIIGLTSLWVLPVIAARARTRILFLLGGLALHLVLVHCFYFDFMYARPNALNRLWGAATVKGLDGGPLGFLMWAVPQLAGSLAYDAVAAGWRWPAFARVLGWGLVLFLAGYGLHGLALLYPVTIPPANDEGSIQVAESPVVPPPAKLAGGDVAARIPPLPFVQPTRGEQRQLNYWLMSKRMVTPPYILAATGYCLVIYAFLMLLCDWGSVQIGVFRTLGQNALAAYIIHEVVARAVGVFAPSDSPAWWMWSAFAVFCAITYLFVRHLEKSGIYLRM
jgi:predicted acyltransferase